MIISDTYEGRDIKILWVLSIVDENFSFFMRANVFALHYKLYKRNLKVRIWLKSDQNSVSHVWFLAVKTLPHPRLSLILLCKNTISNQDLQCKVLAAKNKKYETEFWSNLNIRYLSLQTLKVWLNCFLR